MIQTQPSLKNALSSPQPSLPMQLRNTPPLAQLKSTTNSSRISPPAQPPLGQLKPIATASTLPSAQLTLVQPKVIAKPSALPLALPNSTTFEHSAELTGNPIRNADNKITSTKDLIIELFNKIAQEFFLNNEKYMQLLNMINQEKVSLRKGNSREIMIELKKALEKEIILENKKEIIIKIKELITETLEENDLCVSDDDWSGFLGKNKKDDEIKEDITSETLKEQDSDTPIDNWLDQVLDSIEISENME